MTTKVSIGVGGTGSNTGSMNVSANSGVAINKQTLNFINTSSISVTVSSSGSNANVAMSVSASTPDFILQSYGIT
jgi:hypothetical protein